jgi:hypothetical protein
MAKTGQAQGRELIARYPGHAPPYREIEMKIGEELRERYKAPQQLPHRMLTQLMQFGGESEGDKAE